MPEGTQGDKHEGYSNTQPGETTCMVCGGVATFGVSCGSVLPIQTRAGGQYGASAARRSRSLGGLLRT